MEKALSFEHQKLLSILDGSPISSFVIDNKRRVTAWNTVNEYFTGISKKEVLGKLLDLSPLFKDKKPPSLAEIVLEMADEEIMRRYAHKGLRKSQIHPEAIESVGSIWIKGKEHVMAIQATRLRDVAGDVIGAIQCAEDITDQKRAEDALRESEHRYRSVIENIQDVFYRSDSNEQLLMISPSGVKMFGYNTVNEMIGMPLDSFWPHTQEHQRFLAQIKTSGNVKDFETVLKRKDGTTFNAAFTTYFYYDEDGNMLGTEGIIQDITERKRLEERLQRAEKMETIGTLAGGVAHDLNNVISIVVGYAELILYSVDESNPLRPSLENILKGGERAAAIVQDLLTLARRGVVSKTVLNMNRVISDFQQLPELEKLFSYHSSVKIKTDLEPNLLNISGSPIHLVETLFNLVSNASESMKKGGVVTIKTANQYIDKPVQGYDEIREGDYVVVSVSDMGEGIPAADLKRIFEPFYTKKIMGRSGTGLGLAVVWGTVKDHHGYINVHSEEGKGSTFTLYFPVTREGISTERLDVAVSEYMGKGESILVVDDVKEQRDLTTDMLRKLNYTATSVSSGEEAVVYLKEHHADLLVLDMIMDPGMDGLDTYRSIVEIHPEQKAIIVSGFSETNRVTAAQALGAGSYVKKPYVIEKLGLAVRKELDRK